MASMPSPGTWRAHPEASTTPYIDSGLVNHMRKAILKYLSAGFCACMIACACVQASPSSEQHLSLVRLNGIPMDGYVRIPSGGVKVPLLLLMQGSGCDSLVDPFLQ